MLTPSSWHGVTTLVMGNCGVGFAPVAARAARVAHRPDGGRRGHPRHRAVGGHPLGVGDASPSSSTRSTPSPLALDVGAQVPHGAVRAYVMGERGARNEPATPDDIAAMAAHRRRGDRRRRGRVSPRRARSCTAPIDGEPVPGTFAAEDELFALGRALADVGRGVFELAPAGIQGEDMSAPDRELDWMRRLAEETRRPVTYGFVQHDVAPDDWKRLLDLAGEAADDDVPLRPQVAGRPIGLLLGPADVPPAQQPPDLRRARGSAARRAGRAPARPRGARPHPRRAAGRARCPRTSRMGFDRIFELGDPPELRARARRERRRASPRARASIPTSSSTTCCSSATVASCCCGRCSATATSPSSRCARCSCTPPPCSASATAAPTCGAICDASNPDVHAHALGARPHPRASACRSRRWSTR